ncbi:MAG TPA: cytochrome P450 [Polyangiaceae bacterium]|nr:cytochrome P450 [Polyangiaceae bacterium]
MLDLLPRSSLDPFDDASLSDPYAGYAELRDAGPLVWLERYGVVAMARHAEVHAALLDHESYSSAAGVGLDDFAREKPWRPQSMLLESDPPAHDAPRRALSRVLSTQTIRELRPVFAGEAERLASRVARQGRVDGVKDIAQAFSTQVFADAVGLPAEGRHHLGAYSDMVFQALSQRNARFMACVPAGTQAGAWLTACCQPDELSPDGLGAKLHEAARVEGLNGEEAALLLRLFIAAGVDTTVHALGNALWCFAQHPEQWALLRQDASLARAAFEEVIRFESPLQAFFRTTAKDVSMGDTTLPAGRKVFLVLASANRDPRRWDAPERFDITRRSAGHVALGVGVHFCIGQMLARLQGDVLLTALAQQIATIELAGDVQRTLSNTLRGLGVLPLRLSL